MATATITPDSGEVAYPEGTVDFFDNGALIGTGSGGNAQIDNGVGDSTLGQITGTASSARVIQISGKLTF